MKMPFKKGDPVAALAKAGAAAAACETKIGVFEQQRAEALSSGAELDDIRQLTATRRGRNRRTHGSNCCIGRYLVERGC